MFLGSSALNFQIPSQMTLNTWQQTWQHVPCQELHSNTLSSRLWPDPKLFPHHNYQNHFHIPQLYGLKTHSNPNFHDHTDAYQYPQTPRTLFPWIRCNHDHIGDFYALDLPDFFCSTWTAPRWILHMKPYASRTISLQIQTNYIFHQMELAPCGVIPEILTEH